MTTIPNIQLVEQGECYAFSGTVSTGATVGYSGTVSDTELAVDFDVVMPASPYSGTYDLADIVLDNIGGAPQSVPVSGPFYIDWSIPMENQADRGQMLSVSFRGILGLILSQVLNQVAFETDGNIAARYSSDDVAFDMSWLSSFPSAEERAAMIAGKTWLASPKNLAFWFKKGDKIYVKLNIAAIVSQAMADQGATGADAIIALIDQILGGDDAVATIKALIKSLTSSGDSEGLEISDTTIAVLLGWVKNGIPLNVKAENGHTYFYLDKSQLEMLFVLGADEKSDWNRIITYLQTIVPADYMMAIGIVNQIGYNWNQTVTFNVGLDLVK